MVENDDEENSSVRRHIRFEKKVGVASSNRVMGRTNLIRCMVPMNWSSPYAECGVAVSMVCSLA